jgi:hypothetical protein
MTTLPVVEDLNVLEQLGLRLLASVVVAIAFELGLQSTEKTLDDCVVIAVPSTAHTHPYALLGQRGPILLTGVLAAPITVVEQTPRGAALLEGLLESPENQVVSHPIAAGPAHHSAGAKIQQYREVKPTFPRLQIGNIAGPDRVQPADGELAIQLVGRHRMTCRRSGRHFEASPPPRLQPCLAHQAFHPMFALTWPTLP